MRSQRAARRVAVTIGGSALVVIGIMAGAQTSLAETATLPLAPGDPSPTTSAAPSFAPTNPVDCTDPNNSINCQTPPIDSPLAPGGTAEPGSPYRD